jgi:hypothetical protein
MHHPGFRTIWPFARTGEKARVMRVDPLISDGKKLRYPPSTSQGGQKATPPSLVTRKADTPPRILKKFHREAMSHELTIPKRREFRLVV